MTAISASGTDSYEEFAGFYDAFTAGSDYETWTTHVLSLAREYGAQGTRALDVACGTGKSFLPLLERGFDVTGCDISPAMLEQAALKAPGVPLVEADMRALPKLAEFDLVTCFDDSLNHLADEAALAAALASMATNLGPDGLLLFDLNTLLSYRTTFAGVSRFTHRDTVFVFSGDSSPDSPPGCLASAQIEAFSRRDDGLYERLSSRQSQRHFPPHRVTGLIAEAGLECLGLHGILDDGSPVGQADETRQLKVLYAASMRGGDSR
jgi:SAM-dependent methyltransferase